MDDEPPTRAPRHVHCAFYIEQKRYDGLIIEWARLEAGAVFSWWAHILYWDGEPKTVKVPATRVEPA